MLTENAKKLLEQRYLEGGTWDQLLDRVSGGNSDFRALMADLRFMPNSPTLFNINKPNRCTSSACFTFVVQDSMFGTGSITDTRNKAVAVMKAGGGVGYYLGNIRPRGSLVSSTHRCACGPVAVLKDYQTISLYSQGGKRDLAQMGVLNHDHEDIRDFIHCKDEDPQALGSFNISVSWPDAAVNASSPLWQEQCVAAHAHGCPGMFFFDRVNRDNHNKHLGLMYNPNPCGEVPNRDNEPCNLGSLSLARYVTLNRTMDLDALYRDARIATCFLDNILDRNVFPHPAITEAALLTRRLGLGVMGWADALAMMHIHYDTAEAVTLAENVMSCIERASCDERIALAHAKGPYKGYNLTLTEAPCYRNETGTSIAPTGSIAIIAGVWGGIEPHFALDCQRTSSEGTKYQDGMQDWVRKRCEGFTPRIASEIAPEWHICHQAAFQKHTDLGVSKTINLPNSATVQDVSDAYALMHSLECKGGTVYRDGCRREQVLVKKTNSVYLLPERRSMPKEREAHVVKFKVAGVSVFLTVGYIGDAPMEIFVNGSFGTTIAGMLNAFCITFSVALQAGVPLKDLVHHHSGTRFEPSGLTDNDLVRTCTSIPDLIVRWLAAKYLGAVEPTSSGMYCPECGAEATLSGGCLSCPNCGWSRCG